MQASTNAVTYVVVFTDSRHLRAGQLTKPTHGDLKRAGSYRDDWEQNFFEENSGLYRTKDAPLDEVFNLTNIIRKEG